jgi:hypothetical protein
MFFEGKLPLFFSIFPHFKEFLEEPNAKVPNQFLLFLGETI